MADNSEAEVKDVNKVPDNGGKEKKSSSKKGKKIIIAFIIVAILVCATVGAYFYIQSKEDEEEEEDKRSSLEWGDVYLEVLDDTSKFEGMDDLQIQLCDLDKDSIPELIVYGFDKTKRYLADIYKINDKNEVDTIKVSLDEAFDFKLLFNLDKDDYGWYAVSNNSSNSSTDNSSTTNTIKVYDLNIENKKYEPELLDLNFEENFVEVTDGYSKKVSFDKDAKKSDKKKLLEDVKETYIPVEEMITEEIKEKVENAKIVKNVKKNDASKGIVYSGFEYTYNQNGIKQEFKYPVINISSSDVDQINKEIKDEYGFSSYEEILNDSAGECEEIGYKYFINGKILSLIVYTGGNDSLWYDVYNIDLENSKKISTDTILKQYDLDKDDIISNATNKANDKFDEVKNGEKEMQSYFPGVENEYTKWKNELKDEISKLESIFVNENGEVCLLATVHHLGGQYSCYKAIIINVDQKYKVSEFEYAQLISSSTYSFNSYSSTSSSTTPTPAPTPTPSPSTTPKPSQNTSDPYESITQTRTTLSNITFDNSSKVKIAEGKYTGPMGTITIKNSKEGSFDFSLDCQYMTAAGYPNIGMLDGTAKATKDGNFAYVEKKGSSESNMDYNVIFYIAGGGTNPTITVQDECTLGMSPYCGHNVNFNGVYKK